MIKKDWKTKRKANWTVVPDTAMAEKEPELQITNSSGKKAEQ